MRAGLRVTASKHWRIAAWLVICATCRPMLEVASMGLHVAQMTSQSAMRQCFDAVTGNPAKIMQLDGYGLEPGCHADFVLLQTRDPIEAIRLRATRLKVYRRGKLLAETPAATAALYVPGRPGVTSWMPALSATP